MTTPDLQENVSELNVGQIASTKKRHVRRASRRETAEIVRTIVTSERLNVVHGGGWMCARALWRRVAQRTGKNWKR